MRGVFRINVFVLSAALCAHASAQCPLNKIQLPPTPAHHGFGYAIDLQGDRALASSFEPTFSGELFVLARSAGSWSVEAELTANDGFAGDGFGGYVALSGDRAAVSAAAGHGLQPGTGGVYVFAKQAGTWAQEAKLVAPDGAAGDGFGYTIGLDGDALV